ncbi:hypothetical protein MSIMFI_03354 [Mycobacterium simulans]|nr:hypothetical protein MSIMFI_03354 [Mycobacterium simulans]
MPTTVQARRSDTPNRSRNAVTAQRLRFGVRIFQSPPRAERLFHLSVAEHPLELRVLLPQFPKLLGGIHIHAAIGAAPVVQRRC